MHEEAIWGESLESNLCAVGFIIVIVNLIVDEVFEWSLTWPKVFLEDARHHLLLSQ